MKELVFRAARPVWASRRETEMNCELAFRAIVAGGIPAELRLAASSIYRVWVNGTFLAAGPARAAHGYYRVDCLDLSQLLTTEENTVVIEVVGFNVNSYDTLDQPSFLIAEVLRTDTGDVLAATGDNIDGYDLKQRIQRVQRYSFQRAFAEAYRLQAGGQAFYHGADFGSKLTLAVQPQKKYLAREVPMPEYEPLPAEALVGRGAAVFGVCEHPFRDRAVTMVGPQLKGYPLAELEVFLSDEAQGIQWQPAPVLGDVLFPQALADGYALYRFAYNATGFLGVRVRCEAPCTLYLLFDEILTNGDVDFLRLTNCNCFQYQLDAGTHQIQTFAAYTMQYLKIACHGTCTILGASITQYQHPKPLRSIQIPEDPVLQKICDAAVRTYRQNALDIFMDCPSRERAGWLCDSFFTARVEKLLTGKSVLERAFLENFLLPERFACLPDGMLPMCYPADHYDGNFIPNWAMWFVLELDEYVKRSGDSRILPMAKPRIDGLLQYFSQYENEYGLLEGLDKWVFVEWSRANDADVVQDVNFPTNMLYARMLQVVGLLYENAQLLKKSSALRDTIRRHSFNGTFFTDNARRTPTGLVNTGNITEVCQYYAFFMGVADRSRDPALWNLLLDDFGPQRKTTGLHPNVAPANAFIGNYLRIDLLHQAGLKELVRENIRAYFAAMADRTGTLWEHDNPCASCNHGFASHVLFWLDT